MPDAETAGGKTRSQLRMMPITRTNFNVQLDSSRVQVGPLHRPKIPILQQKRQSVLKGGNRDLAKELASPTMTKHVRAPNRALLTSSGTQAGPAQHAARTGSSFLDSTVQSTAPNRQHNSISQPKGGNAYEARMEQSSLAVQTQACPTVESANDGTARRKTRTKKRVRAEATNPNEVP